ncbi:MAG: cobalamin-dependent protein [Oscillospiraceae bacterium]|nr:cobalamin-dependent protein [Oscillospiraceae bacterium]
MSAENDNVRKNDAEITSDQKRLRPYGDTMNDGKVQISFTLPVKDDEKGMEAASRFAKKMGIENPGIANHIPLDSEFTMYIIYGNVEHTVDYTAIQVSAANEKTMDMEAINDFIRKRIGRKVVFVGASTGTDAHTVGIDAIINQKGLAGHYGLERYEMIEAHNLGSQVPNEEFLRKAKELDADVLLVSQTVTQKDVHIQNMTELIELMEADNIRPNYIVICGGPRISNELAKELGFDAGFGPGKFAEDVATFAVTELAKKF